MRQESLLDQKRQEYRTQIRKKQLEVYFEKRRFQLLLQEHHPASEGNSDEEHCIAISSKIGQFSIRDLRRIIASLITMDTSLSTFYYLTRFNPQSPPAYFSTIIAETLGEDCEPRIHPEFYRDREFTQEERGRLQTLWMEMERLWKGMGREYIGILAEMKRIQVDLLIRQDFISFLSIVLTVLLVFKRMADVLGISLEQMTLVGTDVLFRYQIDTTLSLLHNMLSGNEELLGPFINGFLEVNCCSFESQGLFYNLFLIDSPPPTKIKIFQYYLNILQSQRAQVLDNYEAVINTLYPALSACRIQDFTVICERIIKFLGDLLTVINMRFQTFSFSFVEERSKQFLQRVGWLLVHLGTTCRQIDRVMEVRSINTFLLNHLSFSNVEEELKVVEYCLRVLCAAAQNAYSIHFFINEEPRLMMKVLHIFQRYQETNLQTLSTQSLQTLNALMRVLCSLVNVDKAVELFLSSGVLNKTAVIYSRINRRFQSEKEIRESCQIIYIDLLNYIKKRSNELQLFYDYLFEEGTYLMLIEMLKVDERVQIVGPALTFLSFIAYNCREVRHYPQVYQVLHSQKVMSSLFQLQNAEDQSLSEKAEYTTRLIKTFRDPQTSPYTPSEEIEDELQAI